MIYCHECGFNDICTTQKNFCDDGCTKDQRVYINNLKSELNNILSEARSLMQKIESEEKLEEEKRLRRVKKYEEPLTEDEIIYYYTTYIDDNITYYRLPGKMSDHCVWSTNTKVKYAYKGKILMDIKKSKLVM